MSEEADRFLLTPNDWWKRAQRKAAEQAAEQTELLPGEPTDPMEWLHWVETLGEQEYRRRMGYRVVDTREIREGCVDNDGEQRGLGR